MKQGQFLFLGTGGSMGVPVIGCDCAVCHSDDPRNTRLRPSGLLTIDGKKILIDAGTDYRLQALKYGIDDLDGLILTHAHHDHTAGIDELRVYALRHQHPLPCLISEETANDLKIRYAYIFAKKEAGRVTSNLDLQILDGDRGQTTFMGIPMTYVSYIQLGMKVTGVRIGDFAYISDIRTYPESIFEDLRGVKNLVVSSLRFTPNSMHFSVDEAVEFSCKIGAERTWLTHIAHDLEHEHVNAYLPSNVRMAYDGLSFSFQADGR